MPHHPQKTVTGKVSHVFAHRFVIETHEAPVLADLTPKGLEKVTLRAGDHVTVSGEMKPSELKVAGIAVNGGEAAAIEPKAPHEHGPADPAPALKTAERNGFTVLGEPRRKPRHFEVLGRNAAGELAELHIEIDGTLRKTRPVDAGDGKWADDLHGL